MASQILQVLDSSLPVTITEATYKQLKTFCNIFETKDTHPMALNTAYLGLHKIQFTNTDRDTFFHIYYPASNAMDIENLYKKRIDRYTKIKYSTSSTVDKMNVLFKGVDEIDETRKTQSDVFNIFITYLLHKVFISNLQVNMKNDYILTLLKVMQYRFFTSLVSHRFKYGANEDIMRATIDGLSNKFAIVQYGSWRKLIEVRAEEFSDARGIHYTTISKYPDDKGPLYLITDLQTRLRNQINIITTKYYQNKEEKELIKSYSITGSDIDGDKIILDQKNIYENMTIRLMKETYVLSEFIDNDLVSVVCKLYNSITPDTFKLVLRKFSEKVIEQSRIADPAKGLDEVRITKDLEIYLGTRIYTYSLIQSTYRFCIISKVNMKSKLEILKAVKDVYSSSRTNNQEILSVKESTSFLVDSCGVSKRAATLASLKLALITYFIIKSFKYL